jgi:hypothetical protein
VTYDPDAESLFANRADFGDPTGTAYKQAISDYVIALKAVSGLWENITQLIVFAGATTAFTALRPIKGASPTGVNLVDADVDIKTGVKGDGSTKYIQSGYSGLVVGASQNDCHIYGYYTEMPTTNATALFGQGGATTTGGTMILYGTGANSTNFKCRAASADAVTGNTGVGGYGVNRNASGSYQAMRAATASTITRTSQSTPARRLHILARTGNSDDTPANYSDARILVWATGKGITSLADYTTATADFVTALNAI